MAEDDLRPRPGRSRDAGAGAYRKARSLVGRVVQLSRRGIGSGSGRGSSGGGTGAVGRGRAASLRRRPATAHRRVVVKARVVRHRGARFRAAPLARHVGYLERDGVTRDGQDGKLFDRDGDGADGDAFAGRCEDDRHHFRFVVSPEDAIDMGNLRAFTRELMDDMARDLDTRLDWVAIDHWNTDNPHVHVLVRGVTADGADLVIDRGYISHCLRARAEDRVTLELGPRSELEIETAWRREVDAERWTGLDRMLARDADGNGMIDLRPAAGGARDTLAACKVGRAQVLERMGLAERTGPACWRIAPTWETTLRDLGDRGDIIRTMHRALADRSDEVDPARFALHAGPAGTPVIGRLVERGLHDELTGEAYAIVDGIDGRQHHLRFPDIDRTGDAAPGAIVECASWTDRRGREQSSMLVRSDLGLSAQVTADGATWLDRQLVSPDPARLADGFGAEVREALRDRAEVLCERGLARRAGARITFASGLLGSLRAQDVASAAVEIAGRTALELAPAAPGDPVAGIYRERVILASGRFALIDDGCGFQLVPWRQDLDRRLGQEVAGMVNERGGVDWTLGRVRGPSL